MGHNVIFSSNFINRMKLINEIKLNKICEYIALPVMPIKVVLTYSNKPELDHFERAVISLFLNGYYNKEDIAGKLLLDIELVNLIIEKLQKNQYIDKEWRVTNNGLSIIKGIYSEIITRIAYVFYDLNTKRLISDIVNESDLYTFFSYEKDRIIIETDAYNYSIEYSSIESDSKNEFVTDEEIDRQLRALWKNGVHEGKRLISITKIQNEKKHYLLTTIETEIGNVNGLNWLVQDPLIDEVNYELQSYIYNQSVSDNKIGNVVSRLLSRRYNLTIKENIKNDFVLVKNELFLKKISDEYDILIEPIIRVISTLKESSNYVNNISNKIEFRKSMRHGMLYMGDLFETILYISAYNSNFKHTEGILTTYKTGAQPLLISIAKSIGFEINEDGEKLLYMLPSNILKAKKRPETKMIGSCVAWNLLISENDSNFFFYDLAKKYPYFINMMYYYKRNYRDKVRHSIDDEIYNPKLYIEVLFKLIEYVLDYELNYQVLDNYLEGKSTINDYSYSFEFLRQKLGNEVFESSIEGITKTRQSLIAAYDLYLLKSSAYIPEIRSVFEDVIKNILVYLIKKYKIDSNFNLKEYFSESSDFKKIIVKYGFDCEVRKEIKTSIEEALRLSNDVEIKIKNGIKTNFINTNFRFKIQALILFLELNGNVVKEFGITNSGMKNFFTHCVSIMYIDKGHQQQQAFEYSVAKILIEDSVELLSNLYNKAKIKYWED